MGGAESHGGTDSGMLTFHTQNGYVVSAVPPERMRITSAGNVGIGDTDTYGVRMHIAGVGAATSTGTGSSNIVMLLRDTTAGAQNVGAGIAFAGNDGANTGVTFATINGRKETGTSGDYASYLSFQTRLNGNNLTERMRITSDGNVGIGTTAPSGKLQIGNGTSNSPSSVAILSADGGNAVLNALSLVNSRAAANGNGTSINFHNANNYGATGRITSIQDSGTNASLRFSVYNSTDDALVERITLLSTGNVGIGTTAPDTKLSIQNDSATTNAGVKVLTLTQSTSGTPASGLGPGISFVSERPSSNVLLERAAIYGIAGADPDDDGDLAFYTRTDTGAIGVSEKVRITSAGNVGIGTESPGAKLEVFGTGNTLRLDSAANGSKEILFRNVGTGTATIKTDGDLKLYVEDAGKNILFDTTGGEKMRITAAGNVGIGTTAATAPGFWYDATNKYLAISHWTTSTPPTPAAMLHLSGNANNLNTPQIRIEGRENPGDTKLDIAVSDSNVRFNLVENSGDTAAGYGLMTFKTNAEPQATYPSRGGFLFQVGSASVLNALLITNQGNVGIGTTGPGYKLDVSNGSSNVYIRAITSGAANWATLLLENGDGSWHVTNDDTGTFNIGTGNDPSAQQKLTIASTGAATFSSSVDGIVAHQERRHCFSVPYGGW
jgi:hypothetical protein